MDAGEILLDAPFGRGGFVAANADCIKFGALPGSLHRCGQVYITVRAMYQVVSIPSRDSALLRPSGLVGDSRGQYRLSVTKIHRGPPPQQGLLHRCFWQGLRRYSGLSGLRLRSGAPGPDLLVSPPCIKLSDIPTPRPSFWFELVPPGPLDSGGTTGRIRGETFAMGQASRL
jgi:hypothetical protein